MSDTTASKPVYGVHSEVGNLRKVLVCAPGLAHERLTPSNCDDLLFDDVLWVQNAQRDHYAAHRCRQHIRCEDFERSQGREEHKNDVSSNFRLDQTR